MFHQGSIFNILYWFHYSVHTKEVVVTKWTSDSDRLDYKLTFCISMKKLHKDAFSVSLGLKKVDVLVGLVGAKVNP